MEKALMGILCLFVSLALCAQTAPPPDSLPGKLTRKYITAVGEKSAAITEKIDAKAEKYLRKLEKEEAKLKRKLMKVDSAAAARIFGPSEKIYNGLQAKLKDKTGALKQTGGQYLPWLDTVSTSLKFLDNAKGEAGKLSGKAKELGAAYQKLQAFRAELKNAEDIREVIRRRKQYLAQQLKSFGFTKELKKYNATAYYYAEQVKEYKEMFEDPNKIEQKAISLLRKIPAFEQFMQQNGALAGLFDAPADPAANLANLQTRQQVQDLIQQNMRSLGPNAQQVVSQNISAAQAQLADIRNKLPGAGNGAGEMPDFKPNTQKTKSFLNRLEYGTNLQTVKANNFWPTTTDIGLSVGYKLNDKSIIGIGASYKVGLGKNWKNISITHQGIGARTFLEYKLKGKFFISGGGELNYRSQFKDFEILKDYSAWQKSALLGLSKKYSIGKKWKGTAMIAYDFLYKNQIPRTQPVVFRTGYNF